MTTVALWLPGRLPARTLQRRLGLLLRGLEHALGQFGILQRQVERVGRQLLRALAELSALRREVEIRGVAEGAINTSRDARQTRRLLALASIHDGAARSDAARIGGVGLQIVRDWVVRFNAEGTAGLLDRKPPGKTPLLTDALSTAPRSRPLGRRKNRPLRS